MHIHVIVIHIVYNVYIHTLPTHTTLPTHVNPEAAERLPHVEVHLGDGRISNLRPQPQTPGLAEQETAHHQTGEWV